MVEVREDVSAARCIPLEQLAAVPDAGVGGKASGLARLIAMGLDVPAGFVVVGARPGMLPADLENRYEALGGRVAVRSSAIDEDGSLTSYAGQFATYLDVEGASDVRSAIERCLHSVGSSRAQAYREARAEGEGRSEMSVVVQKMVRARAAGVAFTVDPSTGRRDRMVVDAVAGLGESLVSGRATPDHFELDERGDIVRRELASERAVVDDRLVRRVASEGRAAAMRFGQPLDLEWAISDEGELYWLQARPVTRLLADPRELDTTPAPGDVWTKANIGEMMPGAVTPLTLSVSARGIDAGIQRLYHRLGVHPVPRPEESRFVASFGNHLFLNLTRLMDLSRHLFGAPPEHMGLAIVGRPVPELVIPRMASFPRRVVTMARYVRSLTSIPEARARLESLALSFVPPRERAALDQWRAIDAQLEVLFHAYELHLQSSSGAGAMAPALLGVVARGREAAEEDHARVAELLSGATDVESADIAIGADAIVEILARDPKAVAMVTTEPVEAILEWLRSSSSGDAGRAFAEYLERHGHRAVREAELRQEEWREDPTPVVRSLKASLRAYLRGTASPRRAAGVDPATLNATLRRLVPLAHAAVRSRERTKSLLIELTSRFKVAYRHLAALLVRDGSLPDADLLYFLTHPELGELCRAQDASWVAKADARRRVHPFQTDLLFDEVFIGSPLFREPLIAEARGELRLVGKPVSPGEVRGKARIAKSIEEAAAVEPGEILISPITDVGWTPYFGVIAGLATDIGSAVSHGAVVAREYGLPAVVNLREATQRFRTGDIVVLDGTRGTLRLAPQDDDA